MTSKFQSASLQREENALDASLLDSDGILRESLKREERARRWRKARTAATMCVAAAAMLTAWLMYPKQVVDAGTPRALTTEGLRLWQERRFMAAEILLEKASAEDPTSIAAWNGLGWVRLNSGKAEESLKAFEMAIKLEPKAFASVNGLGQAHFALGDYDNALLHLERAAKGGATAAHTNLLRLYANKKLDSKAKKLAKKIQADDYFTQLSQATQDMVAAAADGGLTDEMRKLAEPETLDQQRDAGKGWELFHEGKNTEAEAIFREVLESNPNQSHALNGLAFALLNQGNTAEAEPLFERLIQENPKHPGALNGKARCIYKERPDEAVKIWEDLGEAFPGRATAGTVALAHHYFRVADFEQASMHLKLLVDAGGMQAKRYRMMLSKANEALEKQDAREDKADQEQDES